MERKLFCEISPFTYQLSQVKGDLEHMTYSDTVYTVTVTVAVDDITNQLAAKLEVDGKETRAVVAQFVGAYDYVAPPVEKAPAEDGSSLLWIGLGVGGGVLVLAAIAACIILRKKKQRTEAK